MNELALFAGAGGGILGGKLLGWRTVCAVEINAYCARRLMQRQNEGHLPPFPVWDDVRSFDGRDWRGAVDVVSGGFPCQDISAAGKGAGLDGERSGLWVEMSRIICEVQPRFAFVENSPMLTSRGLGIILGDLAAMGFDARWGVLGADDLGGDHERERIWIVADSMRNGRERSADFNAGGEDGAQPWREAGGTFEARTVADTYQRELAQRRKARRMGGGEQIQRDGDRQATPEPFIRRGVDVVAHRMDRLRAIGNGQVPCVAASAWRILTGGDQA